MREEKITEATKEFLAIENAHAHHFETQTNLATCYLKKGEIKEAKNHYKKALDLRPDDTQIIFNLGVVSMQDSNVDAAIQYYQQFLLLNPNDFATHNNIAVAFLAKKSLALCTQSF